MSYSWGAHNSGSFAGNSGGGSGKVSVQDFHFTVPVNKASPKLFLACVTGEHIKRATLTCRKAGKSQQEFLKWTFTDLLISSYQTGGNASVHVIRDLAPGSVAIAHNTVNGADVIPIDQVSFNFTKIEVSYAPRKVDGSLDAAIPAGYKLKQGSKVKYLGTDPAASLGWSNSNMDAGRLVALGRQVSGSLSAQLSEAGPTRCH